jgi:DNA-binding MarR family transcriptional regulator
MSRYWKKDEFNENEKKLIDLLSSKPMRNKDLLSKLKWSPSTLTKHLRTLENEKGIIRLVIDAKNHKNRFYEITPESKDNVNTEIGMYNAIQFIKNLSIPLYGYLKQGNVSVSIFAEKPTVKNRKIALDELNKETLPYMVSLFEGSDEEMKKGEKLVFVVTIEKPGEIPE